ncbi:MAG TPA: hypothetical protein VGU45_17840 [Microvirga sp.]|jgi:hypothetical protein|nr:hypothetical protein [Microvirga sp.]
MLASKTPILFVHLIGLALSVGLVALLDLRLFRLLLGQPVTRLDVELLRLAHPLIQVGLILLWLSGLGFLLHYYHYAPQSLANPKVHAKIIIVGVLTFNGLLVDRVATRHLAASVGLPLFATLTAGQERLLLTIGAISAVSWYLPVFLGAAKELNFALPASALLVVYGWSIAGAVATLMALRHYSYRPHLIADYWSRATLLR